jgi:predicted PurR-regulated permease PerM
LVCSVFYFVRDGDKCLNFVRDFVPDDSKDFFDNTVESVKDVLRSIFYGHFLTSVIIGIFGAIGYSLLGYPYGIFLGVLTGILQLIPVFGPWPIYWALFFMDIFAGNYPRAIVVLLFGFFLSTIDMYIRPALSSHYAEIHPLILLIGFLSGPLVYGIVGFIVGPLILGITYTVLDNYRKEYLLGDE